MTSEDDGWFGGKISPELYDRCKKWIAENKDKDTLTRRFDMKALHGQHIQGTEKRFEAMMERCSKIVKDYEGGVR